MMDGTTTWRIQNGVRLVSKVWILLMYFFWKLVLFTSSWPMKHNEVITASFIQSKNLPWSSHRDKNLLIDQKLYLCSQSFQLVKFNFYASNYGRHVVSIFKQSQTDFDLGWWYQQIANSREKLLLLMPTVCICWPVKIVLVHESWVKFLWKVKMAWGQLRIERQCWRFLVSYSNDCEATGKFCLPSWNLTSWWNQN